MQPGAETRVALVTGAARGIGRRVVLTLAGRGYRIAVNDLRKPEGTLEELRSSGAGAISLPGDVSDEESVRRMVEAVAEEFGRIDVLVNNAGISTIVPAEETILADWNKTLAVNLTGPFLMSREFGKEMLRRGSGSIVNLSSVAGLLGIADRAAYNTSKHGLIGLTRTLAVEWGGRGVRVNAVCPGWVKTEMEMSVANYQNLSRPGLQRPRGSRPLRRLPSGQASRIFCASVQGKAHRLGAGSSRPSSSGGHPYYASSRRVAPPYFEATRSRARRASSLH